MENNKHIIAIAQGDTNGMGYELIFNTFAASEMLELCTPVIYGSPKVATYHRNALGINANFTIINDIEEAESGRINMINTLNNEVKIDLGSGTEQSAQSAIKAIDRILQDYQNGQINSIVLAPMDTESIKPFIDGCPNINRYIAKKTASQAEPIDLLIADEIKVAILSDMQNTQKALQEIKGQNITDRCQTIDETLKRDLRIQNPRIAILSINANNNLQDEEQNEIIPAIKQLNENHVYAFGPYTAEEYFAQCEYHNMDVALAMLHDQVIPAIMTFKSGIISLVGGIKPVVTYPYINSPFATEGLKEEHIEAFRKSIYMAIDAQRNRMNYDLPYENQLATSKNKYEQRSYKKIKNKTEDNEINENE